MLSGCPVGSSSAVSSSSRCSSTWARAEQGFASTGLLQAPLQGVEVLPVPMQGLQPLLFPVAGRAKAVQALSQASSLRPLWRRRSSAVRWWRRGRCDRSPPAHSRASALQCVPVWRHTAARLPPAPAGCRPAEPRCVAARPAPHGGLRGSGSGCCADHPVPPGRSPETAALLKYVAHHVAVDASRVVIADGRDGLHQGEHLLRLRASRGRPSRAFSRPGMAWS